MKHRLLLLALVMVPLVLAATHVAAQDRATPRKRGDLFDRLDKNGDGVITRDELTARRGENARSKRNEDGQRKQRRGNVRKLDTNGDGKLSPAEAPRLFRGRSQLDKNGDGFITRHELRRGIRQRAQRAPKRLRSMDKNGDGRITRDEFKGPDRLFQRLDRNEDGVIDGKDRAHKGSRGRGKGDRKKPPQVI